MSPRHLRARCRVGPLEQATRLGVDVRDLLVLEATPTDLWEIGDLRRYLSALGHSLRVLAVPAGIDPSTGAGDELT